MEKMNWRGKYEYTVSVMWFMYIISADCFL